MILINCLFKFEIMWHSVNVHGETNMPLYMIDK